MIRILLVLLAVLIAVLAFALERPWLYAAAIIPLSIALSMIGSRLWRVYKAASHRAERREENRQKSLQELGIMEVRPQTKRAEQASMEQPRGASGKPPISDEPVANESAPGQQHGASGGAPGQPEDGTDGVHDGEAPPAERSASASPGVFTTDVGEAPVLAPYLQALRAAIGAHTVCLLQQDDIVPEYRVRAIASGSPHVRRSGTFEAPHPIMTATMSQQPVTVRRIDQETAPEGYLGYYTRPVSIDHLAVAPIPRPDDPSTYFIVADATPDGDLSTPRVQMLIERFAETADALLGPVKAYTYDADDEPGGDGAYDGDADGMDGLDVSGTGELAADENHEDGTEADANDAGADSNEPRPRRDIIAEEIERARHEGDELALALVHLNRSEAVARNGEAAVLAAEDALRRRLNIALPEARVEKFGELTFGVFYPGGAMDVEPWAAQFQDEMAQATDELEGGVSIGVAVMNDRHADPEALREDATEALREAYETGTCTIVE